MNRRTLATTLSLSILWIITACSDDDPKSNESPQVDNTVVDGIVNEFIESNDVIGLSVATVKRTMGETLFWSNQYGFKNLEKQTPVDDKTSFWLGSVSKAVMGTTLLIAHEKGFVQLDDDIHIVLNSQADFSLNNLDQRSVSIAQLASHTSGIIDNDAYECAYYVENTSVGHDKLINLFEPETCPEQSPVSLAGYLGAYLDTDGEFYSETNFSSSAPGEQYNYSNIGAGLAGYLVELTTGQNLAVYADQEIFNPLSMTHTSWTSGDLQTDNIAMPYATLGDEDSDPLEALPIYELATWPDGGLRSNALDLAKLLGVVMNKGTQQAPGIRLLSEASIERMLPTEGSDIGIFWSTEEDLKIAIDGEDRLLTGHTGSDPGAFSMMLFDPISETGVVIVGNGDDEFIDVASFKNLLEGLFKHASDLL